MRARVLLPGRRRLRERSAVRRATFDTETSISLIFMSGVCERPSVGGIRSLFPRHGCRADDGAYGGTDCEVADFQSLEKSWSYTSRLSLAKRYLYPNTKVQQKFGISSFLGKKVLEIFYRPTP